MKINYILPLSFIFILSSCSAYNNTMDRGPIEIVKAGYHNWSEAPVSNSDVPESGTDLVVIVENWPGSATPLYIIYKNKKSLGGSITTNTDIGTVIKARILRASSVMTKTSKKVNLSDRLVYEDAKGETRFIEIEEWKRVEKINTGDE